MEILKYPLKEASTKVIKQVGVKGAFVKDMTFKQNRIFKLYVC